MGAGIGGLTAALELAVAGLDVTLVERADRPGGKLRPVEVGGLSIDSGPTVCTMRWVFESIFEAAGESLADHLTLRPAETLARHAWSANERLDLFADIDRTADAIAAFSSPAEAQRYRSFSERARRVYQALKRPFITAQRSDPISLLGSAGIKGAAGLWEGAPFSTFWRELGAYFHDPRLRQLFGRYATYCGSSPFEATAILMLVAHVEREGVWLVDGGMGRIAEVLASLGSNAGVRIRYDTEAAEIVASERGVVGLVLRDGERIEADAVVINADAAAVADGKFGSDASRAVPPVPVKSRSLSAVTWSIAAKTEGFPLSRHNVFFSADYAAEFRDIFRDSKLPSAPTVYVCAQDRDGAGAGPHAAERLLILINAPPIGDRHAFEPPEIERCETRTFELLTRSGLTIDRATATSKVTTPADFHRLYPGTGGALYGQASHGWQASFRRPGARTKLPGLYLAGGSVHPGPGVPMAALSGRLAAAQILTDFGSTSRSVGRVIAGGISMRSATTANSA